MTDPIALTEARARAYELFAGLIGRGLTPDRVAAVEALPELSDALASFRSEGGSLDLDVVAAAHQRLFGFEVPPLLSAFTDVDGAAGGAAEVAVHTELIELAGRGPTDLPGDHLAALLAGLGRLAGAEADARQDGLHDVAAGLATRSGRLLDRHLLPVFPAMVHALRAASGPFFSTVIELVDALVAHHRDGLGPSVEPVAEPGESLSARLDAPSTGLKDVIAFLVTPARCGVWLPRGAIVALGRRHAIPSGFGRRADHLEALLFGAIDRDTSPLILEALESLFLEAIVEYTRWAQTRPPSVARHALPWRLRAEATAQGLAHMRRAPRPEPSLRA